MLLEKPRPKAPRLEEKINYIHKKKEQGKCLQERNNFLKSSSSEIPGNKPKKRREPRNNKENLIVKGKYYNPSPHFWSIIVFKLQKRTI